MSQERKVVKSQCSACTDVQNTGGILHAKIYRVQKGREGNAGATLEVYKNGKHNLLKKTLQLNSCKLF